MTSEQLITLWYPDKLGDDFINKLRVQSEFDEAQFALLVSACKAWLSVTPRDSKIDRKAADIFSVDVPMAAGLMRHPNFLEISRPKDISRDCYEHAMKSNADTLDKIAVTYRQLGCRIS